MEEGKMIVELISSVGFPIVICVYLLLDKRYARKAQDAKDEAQRKAQETREQAERADDKTVREMLVAIVRDNTVAITELTSLIKNQNK